MKKLPQPLDATPDKRIYFSIISDYTIHSALCELIDNALDSRRSNSGSYNLTVWIDLDRTRQSIEIRDNAGGVPREELECLVSPGRTMNLIDDNTIGYFGVGSKRAVVALASLVSIKSRHNDGLSYQINVTDDWLGQDTWYIDAFEIDPIEKGTTVIALANLRKEILLGTEDLLRDHLGYTYAWFLTQGFSLLLNSEQVLPRTFAQWAYPMPYGPRCIIKSYRTEDGREVDVEISAGLTSHKSPGKEDYGVYVYCNERLIAMEVKDRQVGYISGYAGIPHSDASLARVIVKFYGAARDMPWNSSKSALDYDHHTFKALQSEIQDILTYYSKLSRSFKGQWQDKVFPFTTGEIVTEELNATQAIKRAFPPPVPKVRKKRVENLKKMNELVLKEKPWTLGLVESMGAVELIRRQTSFETRNRIALILLDSSVEIAFKDYIFEKRLLPPKKKMDDLKRHEVMAIVASKVPLTPATVKKLDYYYGIRNDFIHRKCGEPTESDVELFSGLVHKVLGQLYGLSF